MKLQGQSVIDCDLHNELPSLEMLYPYLPDHWVDYCLESAFRGPDANDYFTGLGMFPTAVQTQVLAHHGDLYQQQADLVAISIHKGELVMESVANAPFSVGFALDVARFVPVAEWDFASLGVSE